MSYPTLFTTPGVRQFAEEIDAERQAQLVKWGEQHHPDGTEHRRARLAGAAQARCQVAAEQGRVTWRHILDEEVEEAFAETDPMKLRTELIQVAAVCAAWIADLDSRTAEGARRVTAETAVAEAPRPHHPVSLATPCTVCGHPYNWHTRQHGQCEFVPVGVPRCGCTGFVPGDRPEPVDPRSILGVAPDFAAETQIAALSPTERTMLGYALDQAQERIWSEDGFTDEDQAAVDSLRRLATGQTAAGARQDGAQR